MVVSIWGTTVEGYEKAASMLASAPAGVVAVEVNLSCPNTEQSSQMFAHDARATEEAMAATAAAGRPRWAKLSPNVSDLRPIADAARRGGAEAVTLVNTMLGISMGGNMSGIAVSSSIGGRAVGFGLSMLIKPPHQFTLPRVLEHQILLWRTVEDRESIVAPQGLDVDARLFADFRGDRHRPWRVNASAPRREDADAPVAQLVADAFDDHG